MDERMRNWILVGAFAGLAVALIFGFFIPVAMAFGAFAGIAIADAHNRLNHRAR